MSLNEILKIDRERVKREKVVLSTVFDRLKNKVNNVVRVGSKSCTYIIPEFIPGYPLVNVEKTMIYLNKKLKKEGFISFPINGNTIFVTWDPNEIRKLDKIKDNVKQEETVKEKNYERENDNLIQSLINSKINN
jgi:hypothetical protein